MSSYTKHMMEVAKGWLETNPDPKSPFLEVPGFEKRRFAAEEDERSISRWDRNVTLATDGRSPELLPSLDKVRKLTTEIRELNGKIVEGLKDVEGYINKPQVGHIKTAPGDVDPTIGRWCLAWARHGYNVLELSADFTAAMLLTDARELDIERVRLPFDGVLMMLPDGFAKGAEGRSYTRVHLLEVPRRDLAMLDAANKVSHLMDGLSFEDKAKMLDGLKASTRPAQPSLLDGAVDDPTDTALSIQADDGEHRLQTFIERKGLTWVTFDDLPNDVEADDDIQARHTIRQIVFGALAYISAVTNALETIPTPRKRGDRAAPRPTRWDIGRTIRLDHNLVRAARGGSREVALRLKHRHIVRGHYRNQAHGAGFALRKEIWITPFWRGPSDGAALVHTYKLDESAKP